jgi:hypothetical protein
MRAIVGCVIAAHHQFEVACHNWRSIAETGHRLLSGRDTRQFKALCDDGYPLCRDEYHLYEEWEERTRARPRYISIMDGLITEDDKQEMNNEENPYNKEAEEDCSQVFFLAYHQLIACHHWLSFCLEEAALFQRFKVSHFVCLI